MRILTVGVGWPVTTRSSIVEEFHRRCGLNLNTYAALFLLSGGI